MRFSWFALISTFAVGALAAPAFATTPTSQLSTCISGCERANISADAKATCKVQCERLEEARVQAQQQASTPQPAPQPTHTTTAPKPTKSPQDVALCQSQCDAISAQTDRATCRLNCQSGSASSPTYAAPTHYTPPTHAQPHASQPTHQPGTVTYPASSTTAPSPGAGYVRPQQNPQQNQQRQQCLADCARSGKSETDRATCELNCEAVGYVMSQPAPSRTVVSTPVSALQQEEMRRQQVIRSSQGVAGTVTSRPSTTHGTTTPTHSTTYSASTPGPTHTQPAHSTTYRPNTKTRPATPAPGPSACYQQWQTCSSTCQPQLTSCLDDCAKERKRSDRETCKLTCSAVQETCTDTCSYKKQACERKAKQGR